MMKRVHVLVMVIFVFHPLMAIGTAYTDDDDNTKEGKALLGFKSQLTDNTASLSSWIQNTNHCNWDYITCDPITGVVIRVTADNAGLAGEFSGYITQLKHLKNMSLHSNNIRGTISIYLGNLTNLEYLDLGSNDLRGSIPSTLGKLSNLQVLDLSSNKLHKDIPDTLGNLKKLQLLYLYKNSLSGSIPKTLGTLYSLMVLYLHSNNLSGVVPDTLEALPHLLYMDLSNNTYLCGNATGVRNCITN